MHVSLVFTVHLLEEFIITTGHFRVSVKETYVQESRQILIGLKYVCRNLRQQHLFQRC